MQGKKKESGKLKVKIKRLHVYLTLVFLCAGYLLAFSYNFTQGIEDNGAKSTLQWEKEDQLREKVNSVQKENAEFEKQLQELQQRVSEREGELSKVKEEVSSIHTALESYRLLAGLIEAQGPGLVIVMDDSTYASEAEDPNGYIIHEQDVRNVVNELFAAGAEGISINGQRLIQSSAIRCVGPTIIVNNVKSAAPFEITAVGNSKTLHQALLLPGGVIDALNSWGITIKVEKKDKLVLPAYLGEI
jgi:uncharacterized protein YlxW (UPF0749 family)